MTRAGRFIRNLVERLLGRYYEGPVEPRRLAEEVRVFRVYHPNATAEQWAAFATALAAGAYRDGFVRGYEWLERDWAGPPDSPERLAEMEAHDWSLAERDPTLAEVMALGVDPRLPSDFVDETARARYLDQLGEAMGTFRVTTDAR